MTTDSTIHPAVATAIDRVAGDCEARHERTTGVALKALGMADANRTRLIVIAGEDGKGGEMQAHERRLDKIEAIYEQQRALIVKLSLAVAGAALGGAGIAQVIISMVSKG